MFEHHIIHTVFDLLAVMSAVLSGWAAYKWRLSSSLEQTVKQLGPFYSLALAIGSITGAYFFGTTNLYLSGIHTIGRSIIGALAGAICAVELYKFFQGVRGSTGYIYAIPFCVSVAVGRIGCFLSGLDDNTHGIPTGQAWGWDYGDHILRYPVQVFESASMLVCGLVLAAILKRYTMIFVRYAFYICIGFYAAQRFIWECFKPYGSVLGALNVFQCLCVALIAYSMIMVVKIYQEKHGRE